MSRTVRTIDASFRLATPQGHGAIAIIEIFGDVPQVLERLELPKLPVGGMALHTILDVDQGIIVCWSDFLIHLMPHAGPFVVKKILRELASRGMSPHQRDASDLRIVYPEASDIHEARMLHALSCAQSPRAIDLLIDQPRRWRRRMNGAWTEDDVYAASRILNRLIQPPLVVAVGRANIGKSTLVNALAQRQVSIVADEPGTTRDHVGVQLILDGLVVRWIDTPGMRPENEIPGDADRQAAQLAEELMHQADCIVLCGDAVSRFPEVDTPAPHIRVGLRADLGAVPEAQIQVAVLEDLKGVVELGELVRRTLVLDDILEWAGPWRYWE